MSKSKIFFYSCLFFIVGIGVASYLSLPLWAAFAILVAGCGFLFFGWPAAKNSGNKPKVVFILIIFLLVQKAHTNPSDRIGCCPLPCPKGWASMPPLRQKGAPANSRRRRNTQQSPHKRRTLPSDRQRCILC